MLIHTKIQYQNLQVFLAKKEIILMRIKVELAKKYKLLL